MWWKDNRQTLHGKLQLPSKLKVLKPLVQVRLVAVVIT
jgi:hypothetical protein